jgi:hypothetical protein
MNQPGRSKKWRASQKELKRETSDTKAAQSKLEETVTDTLDIQLKSIMEVVRQ